MNRLRILSEKTKEELGVDWTTLLSGSHNKVYVKCSKCGEEFLREFRNLAQQHACPTHLARDGIKLKWCDGCSSFLPYDEFEPDKAQYDELASFCKSCHCLFGRHNAAFRFSDLGHYVRLEVKSLGPNGRLPYRKRTTDAGYDIYASEAVIVQPHSVGKVRTDIIVSPPEGYYYTIEGRSSVFKAGVTPYRGIIDGTYQGHLEVMLMNNSSNPYHISKHTRIAQLVLHPVVHADFAVVEDFTPVQEGRGDCGWGSSGD